MAARKLESGVVAVAFVSLVMAASGGAGWAATSTRAVLAARLDHSAGAPLYDVFAGVAALIPVGEPAFRLQLLGALLGALTLAGVVAAGRELLGNAAGLIGAALLVVAPPFREALATPEVLAACGTVWAIAFVIRKQPSVRATVAMCALVIGSAPWLGVALTIGAAVWLGRSKQRRPEIVIAVGAIGALIVVLWFDALGSFPGVRVSLAAAVAVSGRGAGAVVIGAGLLGISFGAVTKLASAPLVAAVAAIVAIHEVVVGSSGIAMLAVFAIGASIVAAAIARMVVSELTGWKRDAAVLACGAPLLIAAVAMGVATDDPRDTPRRLVADLIDQVPAGPGTFIATRTPAWFALQYEHTVAGSRPDLALAPLLPPQRADVIAAEALRAHQIVAADAVAFGRLDETRARPRGRGFQLLGDPPDRATPIEPPADYASALGADEALALAIERAEHEAASGRLAAAARALGLQHRFGAADLAVLSATVATADRPALFGFLPIGVRSAATLDVFGDDLAWIANIPLADPPITAPMPKRLHGLWRKILIGTLKPDAPDIAQLGSGAVEATNAMMTALRPEKKTAQ
ncbi:MAG: hypothetical protein ABI591_05270 [Kofleriaceae bacterium]